MGCSESILDTDLLDGFNGELLDISSVSSHSEPSVDVGNNKHNPYNRVTTIIQCNENIIENPCYAPDWSLSVLISNRSLFEINNDLKKGNWLTTNLLLEIQSRYPDDNEIINNSTNGICTRNLDAYSTKCEVAYS